MDENYEDDSLYYDTRLLGLDPSTSPVGTIPTVLDPSVIGSPIGTTVGGLAPINYTAEPVGGWSGWNEWNPWDGTYPVYDDGDHGGSNYGGFGATGTIWDGNVGSIPTYPSAAPGGMTGIIGSNSDTAQPPPPPPPDDPNHGVIQPVSPGGILDSGIDISIGGILPIGGAIGAIGGLIGGMGPSQGSSTPTQQQNPTLGLPVPITGPQQNEAPQDNPTLNLPPVMGPTPGTPPEDNPTLDLPVVPPPSPTNPSTAIGNINAGTSDTKPTQIPVLPLPPPSPTSPNVAIGNINTSITSPNESKPPTTNIPVIIPPIGGGTTPTAPTQNTPSPAVSTNLNLNLPASSPITIADPRARDLYREGTTSNAALGSVTSGALQNYSANSGNPGMADMANFISLLGQMGYYNQNLTGKASQQTIDSNSALRNANIADVNRLAPQALAARQQANPELYNLLGQYSGSALQTLQSDMARQGGQLTPGEVRNSQQAAREAYASRGRLNDNTAIAGEVLARDNAMRQREQQNRGYLQQSMQNAYGAIGAQSANAFDPFGAILGAQYGMQTSNQGSNNALYQQGVGFSSGQNSNQYVQQLTNPLGAYPSDVYGSNFNMENARRISEANNSAAMAGAKTNATYQLAGNVLQNAGTYGNWAAEFAKLFG